MEHCRTNVLLLILLAFGQSTTEVAAIVTMGIGVQLVNEDPGRLFTFVNEDVNSVSFQISAFEDVSVRLYSQDSASSATPGQDYTPIDETYNLSSSATIFISVNITDDNLVESVEYIGIMVENNITLTSDQYFLFIENNDRLSVAFEQDAYSTSESKPANICATTVNGSIERPQPVSLTLITSPGTASPFDDYVPIRSVMEFETDGPTTLCVNIATVEDSIVEDTEIYFVLFESAAEVEVLGPSNSTVYIIDEDGANVRIFNIFGDPAPFLGEIQVNESNTDNLLIVYVGLDSSQNATVTLQRNVDILLSTSIGTADDSDFIIVTDELQTIQSGSDVTSFNITILGDIIPEGDEQFTFNISTVNSLDQVLSPSLGTVTILNDDEVPDCSIPPSPGENGQVDYNATTYLNQANYRCDSGYLLAGGNDTRVCLLSGIWSGENPFCQIVDCGNLTDPVQGFVSFYETTFESEANYTCLEGFELNGNVSRMCLESGAWFGSDPSCNPVDCGDLLPPAYGNISFNSTTYQSLVTYCCSYGYNLIGNSSRYCQANGLWSGEEPFCEIVDCGVLESPFFGEVNVNDTTFESIANYTCQRGYSLNGTSIRLCEADGQWSDSMPQCIPVNCGDLSSPLNGTVSIINGTIYPSGEAIYDCDVGFNLVGSVNRSCLVSGWSGEEPVCSIVTCTRLPNPLNGQVSTGNPPTFGSLASYTCDEGFLLTGTPSRVCQETFWSGSPPECVPVDCGNLTDPINGRVTHLSTTFQSVAEYSCTVGFTLNGQPATRTCQSNGVWSGIQPLCQVVDCGELGNPAGGSVSIAAGTTFGSTAEYNCNIGFLLIGNLERTCQSDGQWSGMEPTCVPSDSTLSGGSGNGNNEFVVIVVCASVAGFILAVIIIVIIIAVAIARSRRSRRETYTLSVQAGRSSRIVSDSHSGIFIPLSGLDHPLYQSVFTNRASTTEQYREYEFPDSRTVDTRSTLTNQSSVNSLNSLGEDVVLSNLTESATDHSSDSAPGSLRTQAALMEAILFGSSKSRSAPDNVIYDNEIALENEEDDAYEDNIDQVSENSSEFAGDTS